jgi:tRNA modification GTPase
MEHDLIAQVATAPGTGAIAVVRMSGDGAWAALDRVFRPCGRNEPSPRTAVLGWVVDPRTGDPVDEAIAVRYPEGGSYTGEATVEISCHGGVRLVSDVLALLCREGARPARPGEFTRRAYLGGRIDLAQAEAVCDLIASRSALGARAALRQLRGGLSDRVRSIRAGLIEALADAEATLDFPEEDTLSLSTHGLAERCEPLGDELAALLRQAPVGAALRDGITVVLAGRPNTGKSSLLNALIGYSRAIVTDIPGTTRDTLAEWVVLDGIPVRVVDTAGLRPPGDEVERLGVLRAEEALTDCDIAVAVFDSSERWANEDQAVLDRLAEVGVPWMVCLNKSDLPEVLTSEDLSERVHGAAPIVVTSATEPAGVEPLARALREQVTRGAVDPGEVLLTSERHTACVRRAVEALDDLRENARALPLDAALENVREAAAALDEIVGGVAGDEALEAIFSRFCLGK